MTGPEPSFQPSLNVPDAAVTASVSGGAHWVIPDGPFAGLFRRFTYSARQTSTGWVDGEWQLVVGATILHGRVTCLNIIDPAHARVGGTVTDSKFSLFVPGTDVAWDAIDAGEGVNEPGDATSNPVAFRNAPPGSAAAFCGDGTVPILAGNPPYSLDAITRGNVQINLWSAGH